MYYLVVFRPALFERFSFRFLGKSLFYARSCRGNIYQLLMSISRYVTTDVDMVPLPLLNNWPTRRSF